MARRPLSRCMTRRIPAHTCAAWMIIAVVVACVLAAEYSHASGITMRVVSSHATGQFDQSAAEIPAYCSLTRRVFVVNGHSKGVDVLDLSDRGKIHRVTSLDVARDAGGCVSGVNSVAVTDGLVAVAVAAAPKTDPGVVVFYDSRTLVPQRAIPVGAQPDMVAFSPNARWLLVANEGEPNDDYTIDPEGTVSIIDLAEGLERATVRTVDFRDWNDGGSGAHELDSLRARGLRHLGRVTLTVEPYSSRPATFAEDVEPESIEVCPDSLRGYACLQEVNAVAELDIVSATVRRLMPMGFKDHGLPGNELDASDRDGAIRLRTWPGLYGVLQPDTIRIYRAAGRDYLVTANEGESRQRPETGNALRGTDVGSHFSDQAGIADWSVQGTDFESKSGEADLGRLYLVRDLVDRHLDESGRPTKLFCFGGRSFSIFDLETGALQADSGSDFERVTAQRYPRFFNAGNDSTRFEQRSRSKGPEPEGIALGTVADRVYAFVGLERIGGIMVYDITDPHAPAFAGYHNHRNLEVEPLQADGSANPEAGDSGAEGLCFISAAQSPTGRPMLVVGNETSGTTTVWEISPPGPEPSRTVHR